MAKKDKDSDLALVKRVKKGDYPAFDLLVLKYQMYLVILMKMIFHTNFINVGGKI